MENIVKPVRWHRGEHFLGWKSPFVPLPARVMRKTATMRENRGCKKLARTAGNTGTRKRRWEKTWLKGFRDSSVRRDGVNNSRRFLEVVDEVLDERWT